MTPQSNAVNAATLRRRTPLRRRNKFHAIARHDFATGYSYDSKAEEKRWLMLQTLERGGAISDLVFKPPPVILDAAAGIKWRIDYCYRENGRTVWEDCKPRPLTAAERIKLKLWAAHGPGLLRITTALGNVLRTIMPPSPGG